MGTNSASWGRTTIAGLLLASSLFAQLDGITVTPATACVGQRVLASVDGGDACPQFALSFDHPDMPASVVDPVFPVVRKHVYTEPGMYTVSAHSRDVDCGHASTQVRVVPCPPPTDDGRPLELDAEVVDLVNAAPTPVIKELAETLLELMTPEITGGLGLVQPGNPFPALVIGEGFGSVPGRVFLQGDFGVREMVVFEWGPTGKWLSFLVPADITGVVDHQAELWIENFVGHVSPTWTVNFTAARTTVLLPMGDVKLLSCHTDSNYDCCNGACDFGDGPGFGVTVEPVSTPLLDGDTSISARHENYWGTVGDDTGDDFYEVGPLLNGWVISSVVPKLSVSEAGEADAQLQTNLPLESTFWTPQYHWWVTPNDLVIYNLDIWIRGPVGTSHK